MLGDHLIDQGFGGVRQHKSCNLIDDHQQEAQSEQGAARTHQLPDFRPDRLQPLEIRWLLSFFCRWTQSVVGLRQDRIRFIYYCIVTHPVEPRRL